MKRTNLLLVSALLFSFTINAQQSWEKLFSKGSTDVFRCVQEISTGGYILAGCTADSTANDSDAYIVRLNASGDTSWTFAYNGNASAEDVFYKVIETSDGGFFAIGYSNTGSSDDILMVKVNGSGNISWSSTYGGSGKERSQDVVETNDGYTIAGYTTSPPAQYYDIHLVHIDFNGTILWEKIIGDPDYEDANTIKQLPDGGYILGGQIGINGSNYDQYLVRTNASGDTLWTKHFGTTGTDNIESLTILSNGYALAGSTNSAATGDDGYLVKTDTSGNVLWTKTIGGAFPDDFHRVEKTADGGFILSGTTSSSGPSDPNMWLVKTDGSGNLQWSTPLGGDNHDHGYSGMQTSDGGYIIAGHSGSFGFNNEDGYVVKLGANGTAPNKLTYLTAFELISPTCSGSAIQVKLSVRNFGNQDETNIDVTVEITGSTTQTLHATLPALNAGDIDDVIFAPININSGTSTFHCFTETDNDVYPEHNSITKTLNLSPCTGIDEVQADLGYSVYPNPTNGNFTIAFSQQYASVDVELLSSTGASIEKFALKNTSGMKKTFSGAHLAKGIYFLKVSADNLFDVRTVVVE